MNKKQSSVKECQMLSCLKLIVTFFVYALKRTKYMKYSTLIILTNHFRHNFFFFHILFFIFAFLFHSPSDIYLHISSTTIRNAYIGTRFISGLTQSVRDTRNTLSVKISNLNNIFKQVFSKSRQLETLNTCKFFNHTIVLDNELEKILESKTFHIYTEVFEKQQVSREKNVTLCSTDNQLENEET